MKFSLTLVFVIVGLSVVGQILSRQESSYQLKKVVYSGNPSQFPQLTNNNGIFASIPIPEISLTNMPIVNVWVAPSINDLQNLGLMPVPSGGLNGVFVWLTNGICYLFWNNGGGGAGGYFTNFIITVVYEDIPTNQPTGQLPPIGQINASLTNGGNSPESINLDFTTQTNNFYYVQASTNLSSWINWDGPFWGNGNLFLKVYPTTNQNQMFYRFSQTPLEAW